MKSASIICFFCYYYICCFEAVKLLMDMRGTFWEGIRICGSVPDTGGMSGCDLAE